MTIDSRSMVVHALKYFLVYFFCITIVNAEAENKVDIWLLQSESKIRADLLTYTPLGSWSKDVMKFVNVELSHDVILYPEYNHSRGVRRPYEDDPSLYKEYGVHSIKIKLGRYLDPRSFFLMYTSVWVSWVFDEDDELIAIFVDKQTDPP